MGGGGSRASSTLMTAEQASEQTAPADEAAKRVILVVTPPAPALDKLAKKLTAGGYDVRLAADVEQAIAAVAVNDPEIILAATTLAGVEKLRGLDSGRYRTFAPKGVALDASFEVLALKAANLEALARALSDSKLLAANAR
jgi:hypothetical protein